MIKNIDDILAQSFTKVEGILREFVKSALKEASEEKLTVSSIEKLLGVAIFAVTQVLLGMAGSLLSNIVTTKIDKNCSCGKKLTRVKKGSTIKILSMFGYIPIVRDLLFCRRCHEGFGDIDKLIGLNDEHKITKGMTEVITYVAQLVPSFKRASEVLKKLLHLEVSTTQIQIVSGEVGKEVFEKEMLKAEEAYEKPEEAAPQELLRNRKEGILYILADGLQVNTRIEDMDGSTWREMKLGLVFSDRDIIKRSDGDSIITRKEYIPYFGSVSEFKKVLFAAAARAGYGKFKKVVVIGDGAQWIWNMCDEIFPDAIKILDFYHLSENVHDYSKAAYPEDEVNRKRWVKQVLNKVSKNKIDEAIEIVENTKIKKTPDITVNLPVYMKNNYDRIEYKTFKENGYFIGSGPIESGNKVVIQQRMKQAGMRWSINGGQYMAALRAKYESNKWDDVIKAVNA